MKDLTGIKYGRLTVLGFSHRKGKNYYWLCKCECGNETTVQSGHLKNGGIKSCGCLNSEIITKHGLDGNKIYHVFNSMKNRCLSVKHKSYERYGGRGITVCDEWLNDVKTFVKWSMENGYEEGLTIDRIDNDKGYSPDNCRWTDKHTQSRNTSTNTYITFNGESKILCDWADQLGILRPTLCHRLYVAKWDIEKAFTTPV